MAAFQSNWRPNPLNDFFFYKLMGEKGDEVQLLGFLNAVLGRTGEDSFTSVEILENKTFTPEFVGDKASTFDVRAVLQGRTRVNVEVQLRNQNNMDKRSLYYWSKEYNKSIKAGEDYLDLPDVISINILDFDFLPTQNFHTCFHLREDREHDLILTNSLEIHYLNMVKFRRLRLKGVLEDPLYRWIIWFDDSSPHELVKEVLKMDASILSADEQLLYLSGDEDVIDLYDRRFKALCDWTSAKNYAEKTGFDIGHAKGLAVGHAEGVAEGKAEGRAEIARKLFEAGFSKADIIGFTGLSREEADRLCDG